MVRKNITLSTTQIILLSFLLTILVGSSLLALPISSADGEQFHISTRFSRQRHSPA